MKTRTTPSHGTRLWLALAAATLGPGLAVPSATAAEQHDPIVTTHTLAAVGTATVGGPVAQHKRVVIQAIEPDSGKTAAREATWLGVSAEESPEALTAQLGLNAGEGLLVTYVAPDSPAAKAGLLKNDVLLKLGDQLLVHPAQLRKLVQLRQAGDTVSLTLYRGGKQQVPSVTLARSAAGAGSLLDERLLELRQLPHQFNDLRIGDRMREQMKALQEAMAKAGVDKDTLKVEIQRSLEQARQAVKDALRHTTNAAGSFGAAAKDLSALAEAGVEVDQPATVVVHKDRHSVQTMVKADATGTLTIVANPNKHLTAHDKDGKLLFDGDIETPEQQAKVPRETWKRVEPMLDEMSAGRPGRPGARERTGADPGS
jgi:membrane-associated protease RseP (regulator of RpoE activity)